MLDDAAHVKLTAPMFPKARDPDVFFGGRFAVQRDDPVGRRAAARRLAGIELPATLERAHAKRRIQFLAGRVCARGAIEQVRPNVSIGALPQDADGCPIWPDGLVGSISHSATFATAAVALRSDAYGLGVDVEPVMSREAAADVARLVASDDEMRRVTQAASLGPLETLTLVFSAKESLFKALYPPDAAPFRLPRLRSRPPRSRARGFFLPSSRRSTPCSARGNSRDAMGLPAATSRLACWFRQAKWVRGLDPRRAL